MRSYRLTGVFWIVTLVCLASVGQAQSLRDPTVPPAEAGLTVPLPGGATSSGMVPGPMTVIVRNGQPYLVVGSRLYAQGQKLGLARIERISETEVWLREGAVLRNVPQFPGIQRRVVVGVPAPSGVSQ